MTTQTGSKKECTILGSHGFADILFNTVTHHHSLHATSDFNTGDIIADFYAGTTQNYPTYLTLQTGKDIHITIKPTFLQYINHSCDPNVFFDTTVMQLVCIRPVQSGDEFGFFYPSAEWEMAQPFVCSCLSKNCLQLINGAAHLSGETLAKYRLTDFIMQKIKQKI